MHHGSLRPHWHMAWQLALGAVPNARGWAKPTETQLTLYETWCIVNSIEVAPRFSLHAVQNVVSTAAAMMARLKTNSGRPDGEHCYVDHGDSEWAGEGHQIRTRRNHLANIAEVTICKTPFRIWPDPTNTTVSSTSPRQRAPQSSCAFAPPCAKLFRLRGSEPSFALVRYLQEPLPWVLVAPMSGGHSRPSF